MQTIFTTSPAEAAEFIKRGGTVAFPTETVYGLGADIFDEIAVAKIFEAKNRPADNPLIAHIADLRQITELSDCVNRNAHKFIDAFFPGPLTIVLPKTDRVPRVATAGLDTIGIRMPRFELAHQFLAECETSVAAPSANLSGSPSPTTWKAVAEDMDGRIDCILRSDATEIGIESTVVDCTSETPMVLRSGSVSIEQLRAVVSSTLVYDFSETESRRSPGLRHKHYSPRATVVIVENATGLIFESRAAYIGLNRPSAKFDRKLVCSGVAEYAHSLFEYFRECDRLGIKKVYCEKVPESGVGAALMDRIRRAALR